MWNEGCLHLDSHLEKLLEGIFFIQISIYNNEDTYRGSLGDVLSPKAPLAREQFASWLELGH